MELNKRKTNGNTMEHANTELVNLKELMHRGVTVNSIKPKNFDEYLKITSKLFHRKEVKEECLEESFKLPKRLYPENVSNKSKSLNSIHVFSRKCKENEIEILKETHKEDFYNPRKRHLSDEKTSSEKLMKDISSPIRKIIGQSSLSVYKVDTAFGKYEFLNKNSIKEEPKALPHIKPEPLTDMKIGNNSNIASNTRCTTDTTLIPCTKTSSKVISKVSYNTQTFIDGIPDSCEQPKNKNLNGLLEVSVSLLRNPVLESVVFGWNKDLHRQASYNGQENDDYLKRQKVQDQEKHDYCSDIDIKMEPIYEAEDIPPCTDALPLTKSEKKKRKTRRNRKKIERDCKQEQFPSTRSQKRKEPMFEGFSCASGEKLRKIRSVLSELNVPVKSSERQTRYPTRNSVEPVSKRLRMDHSSDSDADTFTRPMQPLQKRLNEKPIRAGPKVRTRARARARTSPLTGHLAGNCMSMRRKTRQRKSSQNIEVSRSNRPTVISLEVEDVSNLREDDIICDRSPSPQEVSCASARKVPFAGEIQAISEQDSIAEEVTLMPHNQDESITDEDVDVNVIDDDIISKDRPTDLQLLVPEIGLQRPIKEHSRYNAEIKVIDVDIFASAKAPTAKEKTGSLVASETPMAEARVPSQRQKKVVNYCEMDTGEGEDEDYKEHLIQPITLTSPLYQLKPKGDETARSDIIELPPNSTSPLSCSWCLFKTRFKASLIQHIVLVHPQKSRENAKQLEAEDILAVLSKMNQTIDVKKYFQCRFCPSTFLHKIDLNKHYDSHSNVNNEDALSISCKRPQHRALNGNSAAMFDCKYCELKADSALYIMYHMKAHVLSNDVVILPLKKHQCKVCSRYFKRFSSLAKHATRHKKGEQFRPSTIKCPKKQQETTADANFNSPDEMSEATSKPQRESLNELKSEAKNEAPSVPEIEAPSVPEIEAPSGPQNEAPREPLNEAPPPDWDENDWEVTGIQVPNISEALERLGEEELLDPSIESSFPEWVSPIIVKEVEERVENEAPNVSSPERTEEDLPLSELKIKLKIVDGVVINETALNRKTNAGTKKLTNSVDLLDPRGEVTSQPDNGVDQRLFQGEWEPEGNVQLIDPFSGLFISPTVSSNSYTGIQNSFTMTHHSHTVTPNFQTLPLYSHTVTPDSFAMAPDISAVNPDSSIEASISPIVTPNSYLVTEDSHTATPNSPLITEDSHPATPNSSFETEDSHTATPNSPLETEDSHTATPNSPLITEDSHPATPNSPLLTEDSHTATPNSPLETEDSHTTTPNSPLETEDSHTTTPNSPFEPLNTGNETSPPDLVLPVDPSLIKTEFAFECNYCEFGCDRLFQLNLHLSEHSSMNPFECAFCPCTFANSKVLRVHMQQHT